MVELELPYCHTQEVVHLLEKQDSSIKEKLGVTLSIDNGRVRFLGSSGDEEYAAGFFRRLFIAVEKGEVPKEEQLLAYLSLLPEEEEQRLNTIAQQSALFPFQRKKVYAKSYNQHLYIKEIKEKDIVFGVGPAGTGKTYLAMAYALSSLGRKEVQRIVLTRPVVEAGERLGFLPGDISQKVNPYLRPLYDAIYDLSDPIKAKTLLEDNIIEIAPLAYMRGRTLNDSFVILDEAQNTTREQMKMFLTRLGFNSKMVITGDITQIDLPNGAKSGLKDCIKILKDIDDIGTCFFDEKDVVRHRLVQDIIKAYAKFENTDINNLRNNGSKNNGSKN